ncbi:NH(3)-dependent NAD(+) synthetase [Striga asiatica]|uniref:NH(3)-dependent NAD(+) synthetase n=1 Tax=Striga asiatica TaxID=4170 RepID=A0A5A7QHR8_STRAF|nr:NH(3)-dependent NAD(+) synthetase [Striga asiatica]
MDNEDSGFVDCALVSENSGSDWEVDEDGNCIGRRKIVTYDPKCEHSTLEFMLGMRFISIEEWLDVKNRMASADDRLGDSYRTSSMMRAELPRGRMCGWMGVEEWLSVAWAR